MSVFVLRGAGVFELRGAVILSVCEMSVFASGLPLKTTA